MQIRTRRLVIRDFRQDDAESLYQLLSDAEVMRYLKKPYSKDKTALLLNQAGLSRPPLIYAVDDWRGKFIGYVIFHPYDEESYEIGWVLRKDEWGKGYAQELTEALVAYAGEKTGYLVIECSPGQGITKRIAERNGFIFLGRDGTLDIYRLKAGSLK